MAGGGQGARGVALGSATLETVVAVAVVVVVMGPSRPPWSSFCFPPSGVLWSDSESNVD